MYFIKLNLYFPCFFFPNKKLRYKGKRGAPVAQWVKCWPIDLADQARSPLAAKSSKKRGSIAHSLSLSTFHRPDMTVERDVESHVIHPSFHTRANLYVFPSLLQKRSISVTSCLLPSSFPFLQRKTHLFHFYKGKQLSDFLYAFLDDK